MLSETATERYHVSVDQVKTFCEQGYLKVEQLVTPEEVQEISDHSMDLMYGRETVEGIDPPPPGMSPEEIEGRYLRIHMLHHKHELHERYLLHPRILDVLEVLIGPDVMAMQTMLFIKAPGQPGQGYHQDSYYIKTWPDHLCGAWIALDDADEENGCMYMQPGSQYEPVTFYVQAPEDTDEHQEGLTEIVGIDRSKEVSVVAKAGDVVFFGGHVKHRSTKNRSTRFRRSFVSHYSNARSFTEWHGGNEHQILARGKTHLPFAAPQFDPTYDPEEKG
ncbi:uncharacterized protein METZ01_LOCUS181864 [marine metagenome]|uniref:Fe2OG dioxygenase domain-containing protein n=1 Tax=marine metagenome TaxID=408172 RepID=A0A382CS89_9ZZZZ